METMQRAVEVSPVVTAKHENVVVLPRLEDVTAAIEQKPQSGGEVRMELEPFATPVDYTTRSSHAKWEARLWQAQTSARSRSTTAPQHHEHDSSSIDEPDFYKDELLKFPFKLLAKRHP